MSILPHGWLSMAAPEPLAPAEGLGVHREIYCVFVSVSVSLGPKRPEDELHTFFVSETTPLSQLLIYVITLHFSSFLKPLSLLCLSFSFDYLIFLTYQCCLLFVFKSTKWVFVERL